jgi:cephalosporin-C deacetylase
MNKLFAEGSSQGGALSYACAALCSDIYPFTAIAPNVAFLGDFPDYFQIVGWPAETAKANKGSMTDEEMYAFLSYFDTKNLATKISAAVLASSGLQDGTCPPHTNIAPFNNLLTPESDKEYIFAPEMQHDFPKGWTTKIMNFFKERM